MEKSVNTDGNGLKNLIEASFDVSPANIRTYSPLTLAYIGDAVYDVIIRTVVVERSNRSANMLHKKTIQFVNASVQAKMIQAVEGQLTEEETGVYHRGRNAKSGSSAKNASIVEYRKATGFEALIGYLYLKGDMERAMELVQSGLAYIENTEQKKL